MEEARGVRAGKLSAELRQSRESSTHYSNNAIDEAKILGQLLVSAQGTTQNRHTNEEASGKIGDMDRR